MTASTNAPQGFVSRLVPLPCGGTLGVHQHRGHLCAPRKQDEEADHDQPLSGDMPCSPARSAPSVMEPDGTLIGLVNVGALRGSNPTTPVRLLVSGTGVDARESLEHVAEQISTGPVAVTSHGSVVGVITLDILNAYLRQRLHDIET